MPAPTLAHSPDPHTHTHAVTRIAGLSNDTSLPPPPFVMCRDVRAATVLLQHLLQHRA